MLKVNLTNPRVKENREEGYVRISSENSSMLRRLWVVVFMGGMGVGSMFLAQIGEPLLWVVAIFMIAMAVLILFVPAWSLYIDTNKQELIVQKNSILSLFHPVQNVFNFDEINSLEEDSDMFGTSQVISLRGPNLFIVATFMQKHTKKAPEVKELFEHTFGDRLTEYSSGEELQDEEQQFSWWRFRLAALFSLVVGLTFILIWTVGENFFGVDLGFLMYILGALLGLVVLFTSGGVNDNRYTLLAIFMAALNIGLFAVFSFLTPSSPYNLRIFGFPYFFVFLISASFAWRIVRRKNQFMQKRSHVINKENQLVLSMAASFFILTLVFGLYSLTGFVGPEDVSAKQAFDNGVVLMRRDDPGAAIEAFKHALVKKPDYVEAQIQIGLAYIELGQLSDAEAALRAALIVDGDQGLAHYGLGVVDFRSQNASKAIAHFSMALELEIPVANETLSLALRGVSYSILNEREPAFADLDLAVSKAEKLEEDELIARTLFLRALGHLNFGESVLAMDDLNTALEISNDEHFKNQINEVLQWIGESS